VLALGEEQRKTVRVLKKLSLHWIAGTNFKSRNEEPLPLALFNIFAAVGRVVWKYLKTPAGPGVPP